MAETVRILSIDGGGIRGIIPTMVLQAILPKTKAQDAFHIIAGNSTGGVIATGLSKPNPLGPKDMTLSLLKSHELLRRPPPTSLPRRFTIEQAKRIR